MINIEDLKTKEDIENAIQIILNDKRAFAEFFLNALDYDYDHEIDVEHRKTMSNKQIYSHLHIDSNNSTKEDLQLIENFKAGKKIYEENNIDEILSTITRDKRLKPFINKFMHHVMTHSFMKDDESVVDYEIRLNNHIIDAFINDPKSDYTEWKNKEPQTIAGIECDYATEDDIAKFRN